MTKAWPVILLVVCAASMPSGWAQPPPSLESLTTEALEKSAELAALNEKVRAAEAMIAPVGALPDPMVSVGLRNIPVDGWLRLDQDPMSGVELMLSQDLPRSAKRRLRRDAQSDASAMLQARYEDKRIDIVRQVKKAYFDLQYLDEELAIAQQNKDLAQDMLTTAEAVYTTGKAMQQDVFQAQVRLSQMLDMLVSLRQQRAAAQARLNKLLYRPPTQPIPKLPALTRTATVPNAEELAARADDTSPKLREMRVRVRQMERLEELAVEGLRPDYKLGFSYMIRKSTPMNPMSGGDMWSATVGLNLPWLYRRQTVDQEVKASQAARRAAEQEVETMRNELASLITEITIEVLRDDQQLALLDTGLLPQAEGALAASRATYATGRGDILSLLDNQMNLYHLQRQRVMLIAEHERKLAELEYLVGGSLQLREGAEEVSSDEH